MNFFMKKNSQTNSKLTKPDIEKLLQEAYQANPKCYEKEDGTLYIVFSDFLGETYVNDPKKAEVLEQIIAAKTGRQVKVKMILQADEHVANTRLSKVQVEEALENLVHADIEIEDD